MYGQPLVETVIARETVDPLFRTTLPNCPTDHRCRYSDAAFAEFYVPTGVTYDLGKIAKSAAGSPAWDGTSKHTLSYKRNAAIGDTVVKVGRTTGRTTAKVTDTCARVGQDNPDGTGTGRTMLCQMLTDGFGALGGDSGAAVFSGGYDPRTLHGILWGNRAFSPWSAIRDELGGTWNVERGTLNVCTAGYSC